MDKDKHINKSALALAMAFLVVLLLLVLGWIFFNLADKGEPIGSDPDVKEQVAPEREVTDINLQEQSPPGQDSDGR